jgi:hypothetical protein
MEFHGIQPRKQWEEMVMVFTGKSTPETMVFTMKIMGRSCKMSLKPMVILYGY